MPSTQYQKYDPLRVCDICGVQWHKSELTRIAPLRWACPDDVAGLTAEQISKHNANARPLRVRAVKHAKGPAEVPTYQQAEATVLNLVLSKAPNYIFGYETSLDGQQDSLSGFDGARAVGWMAFYLGNLVLENRRPRVWIEQAKAKLVTLADSIIAAQFGVSATSPWSGLLTTLTPYGAIYMGSVVGLGQGVGLDFLSLDVQGAAVCLLALLRAYQATGATKYLRSARAVATFLRRAQCVGFYNHTWAFSDASGARLQPGPFPEFVTYDFNQDENLSTVTAYKFRPSGIICAWALNELRQADGNSTYGSDNDVNTGDFELSTAATLSVATAACVSWWENGASGTVGFGPDTPKDYYSAPTTGVLGPSWSTNTGVSGQIVSGFEYAAGVRGLFGVGGYTAKVAALYTWLRGFASNSANRVPTTWSLDHAQRSTLGTYDPTLSLARYLRVTTSGGAAAATEAVDVTVGSGNAPGYDLRTVGLLAPIQTTLSQSQLRAAKDAMSAMRHRRYQPRLTASAASSTTLSSAAYVPNDVQDSPILLTFAGLSFQTSVGMARPGWTSGGLNHFVDVEGACIAADAYRYSPGSFPLEQG